MGYPAATGNLDNGPGRRNNVNWMRIRSCVNSVISMTVRLT